MGRMKKR
jgi:hypothetical protein